MLSPSLHSACGHKLSYFWARISVVVTCPGFVGADHLGSLFVNDPEYNRLSAEQQSIHQGQLNRISRPNQSNDFKGIEQTFSGDVNHFS